MVSSRLKKITVLFFAAALFSGCGKSIDGSNKESFEKSVESIKDDMTEPEAENFQEAVAQVLLSNMDLSSVFGQALSGDDSSKSVEEGVQSAYDKLDGMTVEQVLAEAETLKVERRAREIKSLSEEISELSSDLTVMTEAKKEHDQLQEEIEKFEIARPRLYWQAGSYRDELVLSMDITNGLDTAVSRIFMTGTLTTPGRSVPWLTNDFNYEIAGGIEPGESQSLRLAPSTFASEWSKTPKNRDDTVFTVKLNDAEDADGKEMFDTGYEEEAFKKLVVKLEQKRKSLEELESQSAD